MTISTLTAATNGVFDPSMTLGHLLAFKPPPETVAAVVAVVAALIAAAALAARTRRADRAENGIMYFAGGRYEAARRSEK